MRWSGRIVSVANAIEMRAIAEPYIRLRASATWRSASVIIGGVRQPYFTTDTAAACAQWKSVRMCSSKHQGGRGVLGNPRTNPDAQRFEHLTYIDALNLRVVCWIALPFVVYGQRYAIVVINLWQLNSLERAVLANPSAR